MNTAQRDDPPAPRSIPDRARVVVIGGGIIGTSVAYHLAEQGCSDVVLLEQHRLTSGTTWHAAGLMVTFGSLSETSTRLRQYTRDLYSRLEAETGLATGLRQVGFIELATEPDRLEEFRRVAAFNRHCGVDVHEISPGEVKELFPLARVDDVLAGFYVAEDGRVNPVDVTMSLARGARMRGVRIVEGVAATAVLRTGSAANGGARVTGVRVTGVCTPLGDIEAEFVVNCTGVWARQLGEAAGVTVALQAAEHYYLVTEPIDGCTASLPVLEDPASFGYFREEGGGLLLGLFESVCAPWRVGGVPDNFAFGTLPPDWDRMAPYLQAAMARVPAAADAGVRTLFCGPESFTPDLQPIIGEAPELAGYFVAAGLNSIGILTGGGIGRAMATWILQGRPDIDVTGMNIDRLHPYQANPEYRATRTVESLGQVYQCHYPGRSMRTARGAKRSAIHDRLAERGAHFRDVSGWEAPDWFTPADLAPPAEALSWARQPWFGYWEAEHHAARTEVVLIDMSFMAKFLVQGRDAGRLLERVSANRVDGEPGVITYTQWLNEAGTIEADVTVTKLTEDRFLVVASDTAHRHAETWLRRHLGDAHAFVTDVTSGYTQLNVQGPRSRDLLATLTSQDLTNEAFPFRTAREIDLGFARVVCVRITYIGELGYELYIPTEQAAHVYERLIDAGGPFGLRHAGLKALSSLRLEKGYRDYGHDIDNTDSVLAAGLGFAVALDKPGGCGAAGGVGGAGGGGGGGVSGGVGFIGRDAVVAERQRGPLTRRLVQVLLTDPYPLMFHGEVVHRDRAAVGYVRAASYGFTLGGAVGLAMIDGDVPVDQEYLDTGAWTVEVANRRYPAVASLRPLYDPTSERVRR